MDFKKTTNACFSFELDHPYFQGPQHVDQFINCYNSYVAHYPGMIGKSPDYFSLGGTESKPTVYVSTFAPFADRFKQFAEVALEQFLSLPDNEKAAWKQ